MNRDRFLAFAITIAFAIAIGGCAERAADPRPDTVSTTATATTSEVALEPAYPEDVSTATLTEEDKAQQQTHSHGDGEAHSHESGTGAAHAH
jgi:hypothetical protein